MDRMLHQHKKNWSFMLYSSNLQKDQIQQKKPSMLNVVSKAKWDAWTKLGKINKEEAMRKYIQKITEVAQKIPGKESEALKKDLQGSSKL